MMRNFEYNNKRYRNPDHVAMAGSKLRKYGHLHFATGLLEAGLEHFKYQDCTKIKHILGSCYRAAGRLDEAIPLLKDVLRVVPNNHYADIELAKIYTSQGEYDLARDHGRHVLQISPYNEHGMLALIQIETLTGHTKNAADLFERMASLDRRTPAFYKMLEIAENIVHPEAMFASTQRAFETAAEVVKIPTRVLPLTRAFRHGMQPPSGQVQQETGEFDMAAYQEAVSQKFSDHSVK